MTVDEGTRTTSPIADPADRSEEAASIVPDETIPKFEKILLILIPVLAALGPHASANFLEGSSSNAYRALAVLLILPTALAVWTLPRHASPASKALLSVVALWCVLAPVSMLSSPTRTIGLNAVISISLPLIGCVAVTSISRGRIGAIRTLNVGWLAAFLATGSVGVWELSTGDHLAGNVAVEANGLLFAASTFYNPNNYGAFLLVMFPALASCLVATRSTRTRFTFTSLVVFWAALALSTQSRTAVVGAAGTLLALALWLFKRSRVVNQRPVFPWTLIFIVAFMLLALLADTEAGAKVLAGFQWSLAQNDSNAYSDQLRMNLTKAGFRVIADSHFLGVGAGSFEYHVTHVAGTTDLDGLTNAHNAFVEFAAEYGVLIALALAMAVILSAFEAFRPWGRKLGRPGTMILDLRFSVALGCSATVAASLVSSSTLAAPWWWISIGHVVAQAAVLTRIRRESLGNCSLGKP